MRKNIDNKKTIFNQAFTIVELLVVIVVIGILAAITIVTYRGITTRADIASLQTDLTSSSKRIELYYATYDVYPIMSAPNAEGIICPTTPVDNNYCLDPSSGTTFAYNLDANPDIAFVLTATRGSLVYAISKGAAPAPVTSITAIAAISGSTQVGQTLTAGAVSPAGATVSYQWQSSTSEDGTYTDIPGATSNNYVVTAGDNGKFFKVVATAIGFYNGTQTSAASSQVPIPITGIASISGSTQVGQTLTAGTLSPAGATASYQWQSSATSNGTYADIPGANSSTYVISPTYANMYIKVIATGSGSYTGTQTSSASAQVSGIAITSIGAITGTAQTGQTLTAGAVAPGGATVSYQWQASATSGGVYTNILNATGNTYVVSPAYSSKYIKVVATGIGGYNGTQTSAYVQVAVDSNWLTIGTQTWAKTNLNVGTMITATSQQTNNAVTEKYCYSNSESNCTTYGGMYQWAEAMQYSSVEGSRGLCPAGSHIPTASDWTTLFTQLGTSTASTKLKPGGASGLNMPLGGVRNYQSFTFNSVTVDGLYWSSTESTPGSASTHQMLDKDFANVITGSLNHGNGASVRCIGN